MSALKIVAIAGSLRKESYNQKIINQAAHFAKQAGAEVEIITLSELAIPLFNEDIEQQGTPADVQFLKDKLRAADGILLASPEYNGSITAPLKNAIDWASRTEVDAQPAFNHKVVALFAASPGGLGGVGYNAQVPYFAWADENIPPSQVKLRVSETSEATRAIIKGLGIGGLQHDVAAQYDDLVPILHNELSWSFDVWLVTHHLVHRTAKVQAFAGLLKAHFKKASAIYNINFRR